MLGNLSVSQIETRLCIEFPESTREFMNRTHQPNANNITEGKWHCFDIPFVLVCGDKETATIIYTSVADRSSECKEPLQFSLSGGK